MAARVLASVARLNSALKCSLLILILISAGFGQSEPNTENGFKPYGTYSGSNIDTINLENGNLLLHIPMPFSYPQRGKVQPSYFLGISSKQWSVTCSGGTNCSWFPAFMIQALSPLPAARGVGVGFDTSLDMIVTRSKHTVVDNVDPGLDEYSDVVSAINTADGSSHSVWWNGTVYVSNDVTGYLVIESNPDANGIFQNVTVRDRAGNVYSMGPYQNLGACKISTAPDNTDPNNPGTITTSDCTQAAQVTAVTDPNGNQVAFGGQDTLGRAATLQGLPIR